MLREIVKPDTRQIIIDIPEEYVGKSLEILIFSKSEVYNDNKKLLKEFQKATKNPVKPQGKYYIGMENEMYEDDLF